jgi:hypothetical protein
MEDKTPALRRGRFPRLVRHTPRTPESVAILPPIVRRGAAAFFSSYMPGEMDALVSVISTVDIDYAE